jgi:hypothetical protein
MTTLLPSCTLLAKISAKLAKMLWSISMTSPTFFAGLEIIDDVVAEARCEHECVIALATRQHIVACAASRPVGISASVDDVIAAHSIDIVLALAACDDVVLAGRQRLASDSRCGIDRIGFRRSPENLMISSVVPTNFPFVRGLTRNKNSILSEWLAGPGQRRKTEGAGLSARLMASTAKLILTNDCTGRTL